MRLYVPVVAPQQFDVAVSYRVRRLEENASSENFMSAAFELDSSPELFARGCELFSRFLVLALEGSSFRTLSDQFSSAESARRPPAVSTVTLPCFAVSFSK